MKAIALAAMMAVSAGSAGAVTFSVNQTIGLSAFEEEVWLPRPSYGWEDIIENKQRKVTFSLEIQGLAFLSLDQSFGEHVGGDLYAYTASGDWEYRLDMWGRLYADEGEVSGFPYFSNSSFAYGDEYITYPFSASIEDTLVLSTQQIMFDRVLITMGGGTITGTITYSEVPLPASGLLLLAGLGGLAAYRKKSRGLLAQ